MTETAQSMRRSSTQTSTLERDILRHVRAHGPISRIELARSLAFAPSTATIYVDRLIKEGFLEEEAAAEREMGRPPRQLRLNPEGGEFVGVDFEARHILSVAVDFSDKPLRNARCGLRSNDSAADVVRKIEQTIAEVLPADPRKLLAIGVGVPGLVNSVEGTAVYYKYIKDWRDVPLAQRLTKKFRVPVFLENSVRAMALAELWFGQGRGIRDFLCIGIRSGIAAGIIADGRLHSGARNRAGEFGLGRCPLDLGRARAWFPAVEDSELGPELQEISSFRAIQNALRKAIDAGEKTILSKHPEVTLPDIVSAIQQRDPLTTLVVTQAARCLGWSVAHLSLAIDTRKIVLAGPLTALGEAILKPLRTMAESVLAPTGLEVPQVVNSTMGEFSGALGAAALALEQWKPRR
jgi:glucokinase